VTARLSRALAGDTARPQPVPQGGGRCGHVCTGWRSGRRWVPREVAMKPPGTNPQTRTQGAE